MSGLQRVLSLSLTLTLTYQLPFPMAPCSDSGFWPSMIPFPSPSVPFSPLSFDFSCVPPLALTLSPAPSLTLPPAPPRAPLRSTPLHSTHARTHCVFLSVRLYPARPHVFDDSREFRSSVARSAAVCFADIAGEKRPRGTVACRQAKARENQERLAKLEEEQLASEETYGNVQQEAEQKGKKLKKLWAKFQQVKREVDDINEELQREREDMLDSIRMLTHQVRTASGEAVSVCWQGSQRCQGEEDPSPSASPPPIIN